MCFREVRLACREFASQIPRVYAIHALELCQDVRSRLVVVQPSRHILNVDDEHISLDRMQGTTRRTCALDRSDVLRKKFDAVGAEHGVQHELERGRG